jgi:hypothetical protein
VKINKKVGEISQRLIETTLKCSNSLKFKEGENFNHRHTLSIPRIALKRYFVQKLSLTQKLGKRGRFKVVSNYWVVPITPSTNHVIPSNSLSEAAVPLAILSLPV